MIHSRRCFAAQNDARPPDDQLPAVDRLQAAKKALRAEVGAKLAALTPREIQQASRAITARLLQQPAWQAAEIVLAFVSIPGEVATAPLCRAVLEHGKVLGLPRVTRSGLVFHRVDSWPFRGVRSAYGINEPHADAPRIDLAARHGSGTAPAPLLVVTPGLAFDRRGGRLGRGGAFYDRLFASLGSRTNWTSIAVGFSLQLVEHVPCSPTDHRVHAVITETELVSVDKPR